MPPRGQWIGTFAAVVWFQFFLRIKNKSLNSPKFLHTMFADSRSTENPRDRTSDTRTFSHAHAQNYLVACSPDKRENTNGTSVWGSPAFSPLAEQYGDDSPHHSQVFPRNAMPTGGHSRKDLWPEGRHSTRDVGGTCKWVLAWSRWHRRADRGKSTGIRRSRIKNHPSGDNRQRSETPCKACDFGRVCVRPVHVGCCYVIPFPQEYAS